MLAFGITPYNPVLHDMINFDQKMKAQGRTGLALSSLAKEIVPTFE